MLENNVLLSKQKDGRYVYCKTEFDKYCDELFAAVRAFVAIYFRTEVIYKSAEKPENYKKDYTERAIMFNFRDHLMDNVKKYNYELVHVKRNLYNLVLKEKEKC